MINKNYLLAALALAAVLAYQLGEKDTAENQVVEYAEKPINNTQGDGDISEGGIEPTVSPAIEKDEAPIQAQVLEDDIDEQVQEQIQAQESLKVAEQTDTRSEEVNKEPSVAADKDFLKRMDAELKQAIKNKDWYEFEALADEVKQTLPKHAYSFALNMAIRGNAPLYVIKNLLAKGGQFSYQHLYSVARFNRHENYYKLKALGLNVHATSKEGQNALFPAMMGFKDNFVFLSLLMDGVNPNIEYKGKRPVDICLAELVKIAQENSIDKDRKVYWNAVGRFRELVKFGHAELLPRHLTLLNTIRETKPQIFDLMTHELPNKIAFIDRLNEHLYADHDL